MSPNAEQPMMGLDTLGTNLEIRPFGSTIDARPGSHTSSESPHTAATATLGNSLGPRPILPTLRVNLPDASSTRIDDDPASTTSTFPLDARSAATGRSNRSVPSM